MAWETVIGLEIHAQLATKSKIFSGASTAYGAEPNTQACVVDLALPGVLPVLNKRALEMAIKFGLAIGAEIPSVSIFARKNYFYPDLPQGYQISQFDLPVVGKGSLDIDLENGGTKRVGVTRAHLEQDAGKSLHEDFQGLTGIDLNRAGTPLLEIVSEPEISNAKEAVAYMKKIHALVQYLQICDGNMQEGSFRCDANISVRPVGKKELGTRTEVKNLNSFRFVERAINYEVERQIDLIESGQEVVQETRLYDPDKGETRSMRSKEEANDYRYFPCPDLLPVVVSGELKAKVRADLPELPDAKKQRFIDELGLSEKDALELSSQRDIAEYFETVAKESGEVKLSANWVMGELSACLNRDDILVENSPVSATLLAGLVMRIADNTISGKIAKTIFTAMWDGEGDADSLIESKGLKQITDTGAITAMVEEVIANNPNQVEQYRAGKEQLIGFFVGQVMKASKGKANPAQVNQELIKHLKG
ncbi:MAG TPA: Asp-tRNA(Asn)/Glu-tRNA(Gln) amidotransferase subunit GatB [Thiotrichaceae bacterium]|nr:Asp-tRNA(Asn)/Glu-tRNA(Gln) amidotransferase subunit GatB [Thiotrichaceae bacterium]